MITPFDLPLFGNPIMLAFCGVLLIVLRAGASRVFFDVVGTFQSQKLLDDASASMTTLNALAVDGLSGIEEAGALIAEQMQAVVDATTPLANEIEMATIQFEKFIDTSRDASGKIAKEVQQVGLQFGFTAQESLDAGARMAQLSTIITQEAVPAASEMALAFGLIGDMSPEDSMRKLINLQQQTNFLFQETTQSQYAQLTATERQLHVREEMAVVLNQLNSVEDRSAATMAKITGVMNEFASQAALTGESIGMMAAMSATLIEAGEEQGKGGRALRMIYARLGANTSGAADALKNLGVETTNADGSLRSLSSIMQDLQPIYGRLNSGQKQALAQQVAGNRHYVRFLKLAENFDRVISLNEEAVGQTAAVYNEAGEAVGFLDTMMNSNAVTLERVQNELDIVNAQFGDIFVPSLIEATEFQKEFNIAMLNMLNNLGQTSDVLQGFVTFQQIMSSTFAPFFTALINVKAMNVALSTQMQISRALSGVQIGRVTRSAQATANEVAQQEQKIILAKRIVGLTHEERQAELELFQTQATANTARMEDINREIMGLEELNFKIRQGGQYAGESANVRRAAEQMNLALLTESNFKQEVANRAVKNGTAAGEMHHATKKKLARLEQESAVAVDRLNEAVKEQIRILQAEGRAISATTLAREMNIDLIKMGITQKQIDAMVTDIATDSTKRFHMSVMGLSMSFMKLGGILMIAEMAIMMFKDAIPGVRDETHAAQLAMGLMAAGMALMTIEMIISMGATYQLAAAKGAEAGASIAASIASGILTLALGAQTAATISATTAFTIMTGIISGGMFLVGALAIVYAVDKFLVPKMKEVTDVTYDAAAAIDDVSFDMTDAAAQMQFAMDGIDFSAFEEGTDAMERFSSSREEMFFGFKAGAVTGDLVKQVQQGGVENFVANTEIIMNNNFNGMTTEEVAEEIIEMIERKAGLSGLNASVVAN
ncbi:MAG: putative minor tail protein [Prokaryotic dsDNA virus sp.]|nr:MAG: putative minor tail protein [Prokaryotic dsDNA virus sp.]|tara:strand:+ start:7323 stop:10169 length:2847 start_codon:yes stop_codon:yes gene_type:complete